MQKQSCHICPGRCVFSGPITKTNDPEPFVAASEGKGAGAKNGAAGEKDGAAGEKDGAAVGENEAAIGENDAATGKRGTGAKKSAAGEKDCTVGEKDAVSGEKGTGAEKGAAGENRTGKETQTKCPADAFEIIKSFGKLYVGGLTKTTSTLQLRDFFLQFGNISKCVLKYTSLGISRGFGYVTYVNPTNINLALTAGTLLLNGRILDVRVAVPRDLQNSIDFTIGRRKIFVGGFSQRVDLPYLNNHFSRYGDIETIWLAQNGERTHRGFCFITFKNFEIAYKVTKVKHVLDDKPVWCQLAFPKTKRDK